MITHPLNPNLYQDPRLPGEWRVKPAPPSKQLPPLEQFRRNRTYEKCPNTGDHKPTLPQEVIIAAIKASGREWVTIPEMCLVVNRCHTTTQKAMMKAVAAGLLKTEKQARQYGPRRSMVAVYKLTQ